MTLERQNLGKTGSASVWDGFGAFKIVGGGYVVTI
jgi:hypothetical protein